MRSLGSYAALSLIFSLAHCVSSDSEDVSVSRTITAEGGTISLDDVLTSFPPGAISEEVEVTVHSTDQAPPSGFVSYSKVFRFEPAGLTFAEPVRVELSFAGDPDRASVFWTKKGSSDEYENIGGTVEGKRIAVFVDHFSKAFVGQQSGDAGVEPDSSKSDVGAEPDSSKSDAGVEPDSSPPDAGVEPDSSPPDAGVEPDSSPPDADLATCVPASEICDGKDNDCDGQIDEGLSCPDFGVPSCGDSFCNADGGTVPVCGNGQKDPTEECDGSDLAGETCTTLGYGGGTLSCQDCTFNTTGCS